MYQLYFSPGACSMAIHIALNELGQKVELMRTSIPEGGTQQAAFKALNPRGQVPVLVDNSSGSAKVVREGGAILTYLFAKHPHALLPVSPPDAAALEWVMWGNATLHPAYSRAFWLKRQADVPPALIEGTLNYIQKLWDEAETRLAAQPYLAGANPTMGDILMAVIANWNGNLPQAAGHAGIKLGPNVQRVIKAMVARPAYQAAMAAEAVEYKAVA